MNPNIFASFANSATNIFGKIFDKFTTDRNLVKFLESKGLVDSKRFETLINKMIGIRSQNEMILYDVLIDIMESRANRRNYYIATIKNHNESLGKIRINASKYATNEIKQKNKDVLHLNIIKHGFFRAFKYTKEYFSDINLDKMHEELANYYLANSNVELMEKMIENLKYEYLIEEKIFIKCLVKLYKRYVKNYPDPFVRNDLPRNLNLVPIN
jgi:hypothetical protein